MHFAVPQDMLPADRSTDRPEPSAARQRAATTAVLLGMVLCAVAMKAHGIETPAPHQTVQTSGVAAPTKVIAPEFCKDQTWPYIDSRCLRRVDNPTPPASAPRIVTPPASPAAAAPVPNDVTVNSTGSAPAAGGEAASRTAAKQDDNATPTVTDSSAASASNPPDPRMQVMQSVFPTATASGASGESGASRSNVAPYQHTDDSWQHPRSWNRQSNFFGFRF
jgi:hypothetical protein